MNDSESRRVVLGRAAKLLLATLVIAGCGGRTAPAGTAADHHQPARKASIVPQRILLAMTSHDRKGDTGQSTGAYLSEIAHPHDVFIKAGFEVEFASVRGGRVPLDGLDDPDPVSAAFLKDPEIGRQLHRSIASKDVDPSRYVGVFFAGGHGAMWDLPDDRAFAEVTSRIHGAGGVVGAVCHGPAALVNVRLPGGSYLVAGQPVAGFTNEEERAVKLDGVVPFLLEDRLVARGGRFVGAPMWQSQVAVGDRLVTGQNPASAIGVAEAMVALIRRGAAR